jgi:threonine dehydrogenase-like Zn-dependent dehydrogenase
MKRVVWEAVGKLRVRDDGPAGPLPCGEDEVCLRVTAAGVCSTDVHIVGGGVGIVQPPRVLGHEFAGVVDSCGRGAARFHPGDRVKCDSVVGCGSCAYCARGASQHCPHGFEFGMTRDGGWSEWLVAPERCLHRLPDGLSGEAAAILDVEVFNALRKPGIAPGETVAIFGAGPAGLIALQVARVMGASRVILVGLPGRRLELGRELRADYVIDATADDPVAAIAEITGGRGVDLAFEAVGCARTVLQAIEVLRPQGRAALYGLHGRPLPELPVDSVILRELTLYGSLPDRTGWNELLQLAVERKVDFGALITHRFPLERAPEAVRRLTEAPEEMVKAVLLMDGA